MPDSAQTGTTQGAVFLSYASQDAEAARRICETLRAAGIEVWFDQSELRGGDAWDAKIRQQIQSCALFVPVISGNTQSRPEGYFRLEWKLAVDRSHLMSDDHPFFVPVVIDDTLDSVARVPSRFRERQWTRLPGGETPAVFPVRVKKLLLGELAAVGKEPGEQRPTAAPATRKPARVWLVPVIVGVVVCAALALWQPWHKSVKPSETVPTPKPPSEARQLVAKTWEQLNKTELGPEELEFANGFCKRAAELEPTDAKVWAAWSQVDSWYVFKSFDRSAERREAARSKAARALKLAPDNYEARLAQSCFLVFGDAATTHGVSAFAPEADRLLRRLLQEKPDEPRALFAFGILQRNLEHMSEARDALTRLTGNPKFAATAWCELARLEIGAHSWRLAEGPLKHSLDIQPYYENLGLKLVMDLRWYGDTASAKSDLGKIPASVMQTDFGVGIVCFAYGRLREPDEWLRLMEGVSRDWIHSNIIDGPTAYWIGLAQQDAGRSDAARLEWQAALKLVEQRLTDQPTSWGLQDWKGTLFTKLADFAEAEKSLLLTAHLGGSQFVDDDIFDLKVAEGQMDAAMDIFEKEIAPWATAADMRLIPRFDLLRNNPRFKALLARAEVDPNKSPNAPKKPATDPAQTGTQN